MVHASALHSVTAKYLNLELSTGNFGGLRMGVCSTAIDGSETRPESHAASLGGPPGTPSTGAASSCRHRAGDPASLRYAAVPQVGRDSRALHGEEMPEDRSRPSSTARLRCRISTTIFLPSLL